MMYRAASKNAKKRTDGYVWRCTRNRNHEIGLRKFSFFERSHFPFADLMQFMKCFVDGESTPHVHQHGYGLQKSVCRLGKFLQRTGGGVPVQICVRPWS